MPSPAHADPRIARHASGTLGYCARALAGYARLSSCRPLTKREHELARRAMDDARWALAQLPVAPSLEDKIRKAFGGAP